MAQHLVCARRREELLFYYFKETFCSSLYVYGQTVENFPHQSSKKVNTLLLTYTITALIISSTADWKKKLENNVRLLDQQQQEQS